MIAAPPDLPDDPGLLKQMVSELLATTREQQGRIRELEDRLDQLLRRLYGQRSERLDPAQLLLFDLAAAPPQPASPQPPSQPPGKRRRTNPGRRPFAKDLPRRRVVHDLSPAQRLCPCCQQERACIGQEVSEQLDYQPASLFVVEHVRLKYACKHCQDHVALAAKAEQPIHKGIPGPGLLAHVIVSKYADHLPLYRQQGILARQGAAVSRKTMGAWMTAAAVVLTPLVELMRGKVLQSKVINCDDTPVRVQQEGQNKTKEGRFWIYRGDKDHPHTTYEYQPRRSQDDPKAFLAAFAGYLQVDAWSGLDVLFAGGRIIEVGCWAHARRHFWDARASDPGRAHQALAWIRELYAVEDKARTLPAAERRRLRQAEAKPVLAKLKAWLDEQAPVVLPKSCIAKAIGYAQKQWQALQVYLEDGDLEIDNNAAERGFRGIALGRRNWLFVGSDEGGQTAAVMYSVVASCQQVGAEPFAYLREVLTELPKLGRKPREEELEAWLPVAWQKRQQTPRGPPGQDRAAPEPQSQPAQTSDV
jgi:transposase